MHYAKHLSVLFAAAALAATVGSASIAAPITHYSERYLNSGYYVYTPEYEETGSNSGLITNLDGSRNEGGATGTQNYAYSNGAGGYVVKTETSSVFASADLSTGTLKAVSSLSFGTNAYGSSGTNVNFATARAEATIADTFHFASGDAPFVWNDLDAFTFKLALDGVTQIPDFVTAGPSTSTMTWASLNLTLLRPGGLEARYQFQHFDYNAYADANGADAASAEFMRLATEANSYFITSYGWCLGDNRTQSDFCGGDYYKQVDLDDTGAANVDVSFNPGGDFEWMFTLETSAKLDVAYENTGIVLDFSHTLNVDFEAPPDVDVYSASGVFPHTLAATDPGNAVPEPASLALFGAGIAGVFSWRKRRSAH